MDNNGKDIRISGSENINIDPVYIDISLKGQASAEYDELKSQVAVAQRGYGLSEDRIKSANAKVQNIIEIAKNAVRMYRAKKTEKGKEELKEILTIVKKAKSAARVIELKYMLESDSPEAEERRRIMSGWSRDQSGDDNRIKDIDVPIMDAENMLNEDR